MAPGSDDSSGSAAPQKAQPSSIQGFWTKQDTVSYSTLLRDIDAKEIKQLDLVPGRREVRVQYNDGRRVTVPVFANDNQILRAAESSGTPLTVVDIRREQAGRELAGTLMLVLLVVVGLSFLLKRSAQMANRALGFGRSQPRLKPQEDLQLRFEDVAGINDARLELEEVVTFLKQPEAFIRLGAKIPRGVLLVGPPGTGKTLLAKAIAGEAGVPFFSIAASEFVELFVGVGASRVRDLFRQAKEKSPCIVFIDEIDAVGRQRGAGIGGGNDEREQTLNQLLTEMDGFTAQDKPVIVLAATNQPEVLDAALLRPGRFDRQVLVDRPDLSGRKTILEIYAKKVKLAAGVDLDSVAQATSGFAGADLANLVNEAALLAARAQRTSVEQQDLGEAIERVVAGLEKKSRVLQDDEKKVVAYHEVGHAIVGHLMPGGSKVAKISIVPRGMSALGYTLQLPTEERFLNSKEELQGQIATLLGGRSAEEIVFGKITTGAANDLQRATDLAEQMVGTYGMSDTLGPLAYDKQGGGRFLGGGNNPRRSVSDATAQAIDKEVRGLVDQAHDDALAILRENMALLETIAQKILEKEVIEGDDLKQMLEASVLPSGVTA
ncbi:MAG: ATP-dependent zinc metalloprotease FtsH [Synechococcus sp.]